jgi:hypothetical protein
MTARRPSQVLLSGVAVLALAALASACTGSNPHLLVQEPNCVLLCFSAHNTTERPVPQEEAYPPPPAQREPSTKKGGGR